MKRRSIWVVMGISWAVHAETCQLSAVDLERFQEFSYVKNYLAENIFPAWAKDQPKMFFYNDSCQFILNGATPPPDDFAVAAQTLELPGLATSVLLSRSSVLKIPSGDSLPVRIVASAFTSTESRDRETWLVMGLYEVWKKDYGDRFESWIRMLAHEAFHPFQFKFEKVKEFISGPSESDFTKFAEQNKAFQKQVDQETGRLRQAIFASSALEKKKIFADVMKMREIRRAKFFVEDKTNWNQYEPWLVSLEGAAEYMGFRVITDAKKFRVNQRLRSMDANYSAYAEFKALSFSGAVDRVSKTKSYAQKMGVYEIILLNQLMPDWPTKIFETDGFAEGLLKSLTPSTAG